MLPAALVADLDIHQDTRSAQEDDDDFAEPARSTISEVKKLADRLMALLSRDL